MALWPSAFHAPSRSYQRAMDIDGQFNCVRLLQTTETLSCKSDRRMRPLQRCGGSCPYVSVLECPFLFVPWLLLPVLNPSKRSAS